MERPDSLRREIAYEHDEGTPLPGLDDGDRAPGGSTAIPRGSVRCRRRGQGQGAAGLPRIVVAGSRSRRPDRAAREPVDHPPAVSRAGPIWPDGDLAVQLLSRRGTADGIGPRGGTELRHHGPALWRRTRLELRIVRLAGAHPALRHHRLRRNPPGTIRVRPQAPRGEPRSGRPRDRGERQGREARGPPCDALIPRPDGGLRDDALHRRVLHARGRHGDPRPCRQIRARDDRADGQGNQPARRRPRTAQAHLAR